MDLERVEVLDAGGRYHERMYDQLTREVREAVEEEWSERAGILEFDAHLCRPEAERLAWLMVMDDDLPRCGAAGIGKTWRAEPGRGAA